MNPKEDGSWLAYNAIDADGHILEPLDLDSLFRSDRPNANATDQDVRAETTRILATGMRNDEVPAGDKTYLAQLVAARTGLSQADAEKRVNEVVSNFKAAETKARQIADEARKAGAYLSIFTAISMLIGAFIAAASGCARGSSPRRGLARVIRNRSFADEIWQTRCLTYIYGAMWRLNGVSRHQLKIAQFCERPPKARFAPDSPLERR